MPEIDAATLGAILAVAAGTAATRLLGPFLAARLGRFPAAVRFFDAAGSAALAALVAVAVFAGGGRAAAACAVAALAMLATGRTVAGMAAGMAAAALWTAAG